MLPKISFQCITYARPHLLEEAIYSYMLQDYEGPKEMIILNDHYIPLVLLRDIEVQYNIYIHNYMTRIPTIGEKRNTCCELCTGDIICPQDDDDISLPNRMSVTAKYMNETPHFKPSKFIRFENGKVLKIQKTSIGHNMSGMSKELWKQVRYAKMQSGQDQVIEKEFEKLKCRNTVEVPDEELYYMYRWGTGEYHLSAFGWGKGFNQVEAIVKNKKFEGPILLNPHWNHDYVNLYKNFLSQGQH